MSSFKNIVAIVGVSFSVGLQPVASYAGGGLTGGALEITQLLNNAELMAQVAESAQQTAQQVNMLATMMQNLQGLGDLSGIAARLGIPTSSLQSFFNSYPSMPPWRNNDWSPSSANRWSEKSGANCLSATLADFFEGAS